MQKTPKSNSKQRNSTVNLSARAFQPQAELASLFEKGVWGTSLFVLKGGWGSFAGSPSFYAVHGCGKGLSFFLGGGLVLGGNATILRIHSLSGTVRDTPPYRAVPFRDSIFALFS